MGVQHNQLVVPPLFYDALSGGFRPPTDPKAQEHTAARLAFAAATKGEPLQLVDPNFTAYEYNPSWAKEVTATAGCENNYFITGIRTLVSLTLSGEHAGPLSLRTDDDTDGTGLIIRQSGSEQYLPTTLGTDLAYARERVTQAMQEYFNGLKAYSA